MQVDVNAGFFSGVTFKDKGVRIPVSEGKLNDLRQLALFGAVANAETVVLTLRRHAVRGSAVQTSPK
jgi:hypothetical protein